MAQWNHSGEMKSEMYHLKKFNTYEELEAAIMEYIEYYNNHRYQKRQNCMTPLELHVIIRIT
ncbi:IS3 family transposase [Paenibacillus alvei]|uniref:IS3 family transposase n=1 Tax=Paenibacillus alvei TaxID=44250 RepID=UPI00398FAB1C